MSKSMFYTDKQGRLRYRGSSEQKQSTAQVKTVETTPMRKKAGFFFVDKDGRTIFAGGPSGGAGGTSAGGATKQQQKLRDIEGVIYDRDKEECFVVDKNGNISFFKKGDDLHITLTEDEIMGMKDQIFTHNHPKGDGVGGTSFSASDVHMAAMFDLAGIRAVGISEIDGKRYVYEMLRPPNGWPKQLSSSGQFSGIRLIDGYSKQIAIQTSKEIKLGHLSVDVANFNHWHNVMTVLSNQYEIPYSMEEF